MKHLEDAMKNLQKLTQSLGHFHSDYAEPLKSIGNIQEIFNEDFWEKMVQMTNTIGKNVQSEQVEYEEVVSENDSEREPQERQEDLFDDLYVPYVDVYETNNKVIVACEAPGLERNSMEISLANGRELLIKGQIAKSRYATYVVKKERYFGAFQRKITLPHSVTTEGLKSQYVNGILEFHFFKKARKSASREKVTIHFGY
ncbi:Hsp20/alpha crystallin family protein [Brevibacillus ruminantium]|uniref:Hsp20/alpha crystallin family protein n=1 Tax=Brevibacillus ruminantium TaxID=2950604 RepID=A0ABY4WH91_9BACL|nr:Hsp20/alpha crystallin family protein [Brevibacillus ruminantium]USG66181.1 Hsp20/alpha crystallin family protein [Brevibacillus ruminantium]